MLAMALLRGALAPRQSFLSISPNILNGPCKVLAGSLILEQGSHLLEYCLTFQFGGISISPKVTPVFQSHRRGELLHTGKGVVVRPLDTVRQPSMKQSVPNTNFTGFRRRWGIADEGLEPAPEDDFGGPCPQILLTRHRSPRLLLGLALSKKPLISDRPRVVA